MKSRKPLNILVFGMFLMWAGQAVQAAEGYTLRIEMQSSDYAFFTVEKADKTGTSFSEDKSTSFTTEISKGDTGSYNFTHNAADWCSGDYKINLVDDSGDTIARCIVHWSSTKDKDECFSPYWKTGTCEAKNQSGVTFERTDKGSHHVNFTLR